MGDKGKTSVTHAAQKTQSVRQAWETSEGDKWQIGVNSCGPRHPECGDTGIICRKPLTVVENLMYILVGVPRNPE